MESTKERLTSLQNTVEKSQKAIITLQSSKSTLEKEITEMQAEIERLQGRLSQAMVAYEESTKIVEEFRDSSRKTQRSLDRALKEIASWNDEIEKSASGRHAIYRRCRLEEIDLPLISGNLKKVPLEEVCPLIITDGIG